MTTILNGKQYFQSPTLFSIVKEAARFEILGVDHPVEQKKRVQARWSRWRRVSGVICNRGIAARVKGLQDECTVWTQWP